MKRVAALSFVALSASIAMVAWAGPPQPIRPIKPPPPVQPLPTVKPPKLQITLPPTMVAVRRSLKNGAVDTSPYSGGGLSYDIEIQNRADQPLSTNLIINRVDFGGPTPRFSVPVNVPAKSRAWVTVADPYELRSGCGPSINTLQLEGGGRNRILHIIPSCTFTARTYDPTAGMLPDRIVSMRAGKLSFHSPRLDTSLPPACNSTIRGRATIQNNGSARAKKVHLKLNDHLINAEERQSITLEPGQQNPNAVFSAPFHGQQGLHRVTIHGEGVPIYQWGWGIQVDRSCSLRFELE